MVAEVDEVLRLLADDLPALSAKVADLVHREQLSYRDISDEALYLAVHRNMETALRVLRDARIDPHAHLDQVTRTIEERHQAGIAMEEAVRAFALCIWQIHQRYLEISTDAGLDHEELLRGSDTLWRLGDAITTQVVVVYNEMNLRRSMIDAQRRVELVRHLLAGQLSSAELKKLGLDSGRRCAAVRCSRPGGLNASDQRQLEAGGGEPGAAAILAVVADECIGVVSKEPTVPPGVLVAMGPWVPLAEVARSFELADRIAHVCHHLGLTGLQRLETLSWKVAAVDQPEIATSLRQRLLDPLAGEGTFGAEIEASVRSFLGHRLSITHAAAELCLHVNTLRYRLRRFEELTGTDLSDPSDLLDVAWAFSLGSLPPRNVRL